MEKFQKSSHQFINFEPFFTTSEVSITIRIYFVPICEMEGNIPKNCIQKYTDNSCDINVSFFFHTKLWTLLARLLSYCLETIRNLKISFIPKSRKRLLYLSKLK